VSTDKIVLTFSPEEVIEITRISLDEDRDGALSFIKDCLEKKVKAATSPHCVPVFEESYKPGQKDQFGGQKRRNG
jgi:hypothetical protein